MIVRLFLIGFLEVGLWYPGNISLSLTGYSDSDFAGCKIDKKSTSGTCHLLGSSLISCNAKSRPMLLSLLLKQSTLLQGVVVLKPYG